MLGKGLESLIPPNQRNGGSDDQAPGVPPVDNSGRPVLGGTNFGGETNPSGLGFSKPLSSKDGEEKTSAKRSGTAIFQIEIEKIKPNPHQPRKDFDEAALRDLAASIREVGILQPLVVTKVEKETPTGTDVEYVLIAGERRLLASKLLGLERVPAIVRRVDFERERLTMAIVENLQREDLNPVETARAFSRLQDEFGLTQREIATRLGKSREAIANSVRLLDLPVYIQAALSKGEITETHGRLLLAVSDPAAQKKLFDDLLLNRLTTRELKERVKPRIVHGASTLQGAAGLPPEMKIMQEELTSKLGAPVTIETKNPSGSGKITITFFSEEELKGIVSKLDGSN
ncbi:MAG: chromosome partitioning protein, ParB family [Parcubacteria group bacterium Gr01-1014_20]|nr:MAG: chromosome partitioning protein, ParB family [Parcubacteria group bacterium Gr01-1014_20]